MPFTSIKQEVACFASHGFNGKVDCKEWASKTDQSKLPTKKPSLKVKIKKKAKVK